MKLYYSSEKLERQCTSVREARRLFGGDLALANKLLARIYYLQREDLLTLIIRQPALRFHNLKGKYQGLFAIDVKTRREPWRIIMEPLDDNGIPYDPCHIDEIADMTKTILIREVSKHYE